jgi:hypothetical protein
MQGLVNLLPNGPDDGGLIVCPGGHLLSDEFHKDMADEPRIPAWTPEWFGFTENGMKWLEEKGLKWIKVCAEPGDLLLWYVHFPSFTFSAQVTNQPKGTLALLTTTLVPRQHSLDLPYTPATCLSQTQPRRTLYARRMPLSGLWAPHTGLTPGTLARMWQSATERMTRTTALSLGISQYWMSVRSN